MMQRRESAVPPVKYRLLTIKGRGVMSTPVFGAEETGCHEKKKFFMECKILKQQQQQKHPRWLHYIQLGVLTTTLVYLKQATFAQICKLVSCLYIYARNLSPLRATLFCFKFPSFKKHRRFYQRQLRNCGVRLNMYK